MAFQWSVPCRSMIIMIVQFNYSIAIFIAAQIAQVAQPIRIALAGLLAIWIAIKKQSLTLGRRGGGDKVSMLTHRYPHKLPWKIKVAICSYQADSPFYLWPIIWCGDWRAKKEYGLYDTECPFWDQVSLNNTTLFWCYKMCRVSCFSVVRFCLQYFQQVNFQADKYLSNETQGGKIHTLTCAH